MSSDGKIFIVEENERGGSSKVVGDDFRVSSSVVWIIHSKWEIIVTKHRQEERELPLKL